ncbi:MAG: DUF58 domain-containing protein [Gammaproteobacteria bacterium]
MVFSSLIEKLSRYYRRGMSVVSDVEQTPLLDETALQELAHYAQALPWSLLEFQRPSAHPLIGETLSFHRGRGFEFEENRAYQAGDEPRLLNWRLYARSGELYTKVFTEERRPQVFLLVDRRAAMRFATHRQLKAALAAKIAACYAYQSQHQALAVGGLILNQMPEWFSPARGEMSLDALVQSLAAPCPPLAFEADQPDFEESLRLLMHRLPAGSFVLLVSDFCDFNPDAAAPVLQQLAMLHTVHAIQILDPVEQRLPAAGDFLIADDASLQPLRIDAQDEVQCRLYEEAFNDGQAKLAACFHSCNIPFKTCTTQQDVEDCLDHADDAAVEH